MLIEPRIQDVLHMAADVLLLDDESEYYTPKAVKELTLKIKGKSVKVKVEKNSFSCCAVEEAIRYSFLMLNPDKLDELTHWFNHKERSLRHWGDHEVQISDFIDRVQQGLRNMGLCTASSGVYKRFKKEAKAKGLNALKEVQQARYVWLKFAAMMAEEQGV